MSNALSIFNHPAVYKRPGLLGRNVFDDVFGVLPILPEITAIMLPITHLLDTLISLQHCSL